VIERWTMKRRAAHAARDGGEGAVMPALLAPNAMLE
jgi:hypothetical protein